jgi:hypothetical protein
MLTSGRGTLTAGEANSAGHGIFPIKAAIRHLHRHNLILEMLSMSLFGCNELPQRFEKSRG